MMPVTTLDANTALVVIDLQKGILGSPLAHPTDGVLHNASRLVDAFHARILPVVLVNVIAGAPGRTEQAFRGAFPPDFAELVPELHQRPSDVTVSKQTWGAFASTDIDAQLKQRHVTQIVLCGVATSIGVESTARQAYEAGYNVTLALDAMTDRSLDAHNGSVKHVFPKLGETGTTDEILALLGTAK